jgi:hypothetical protein
MRSMLLRIKPLSYVRRTSAKVFPVLKFRALNGIGQMRATAPAQTPGAKISVCHSVGGMFVASGTIIMSNEGS